jgi:DNA/RNA-binding domain of Phe-tRNA-synthetase-like protein
MNEGPPEIALEQGWVDAEVAAEFPELRIAYLEVPARSGRSPRAVKDRLRRLSDRMHGAQAIVMRQWPIPWAYRVFFRHVGLDPDETRTPVEAAAFDRILRGGFRSQGLLEDALLVAVVETGVPVWAVDASRVEGPLGIRQAQAAERLGGEEGPDLPSGRLVVADADGAVGVLFGELAADRQVTHATTTMTLFAVAVAGVPEIHVEEALWIAVSVLEGA